MRRIRILCKWWFRGFRSSPSTPEQEELLSYLRGVYLNLRFGVAVMLAAIIILFVLCRLLEWVK